MIAIRKEYEATGGEIIEHQDGCRNFCRGVAHRSRAAPISRA